MIKDDVNKKETCACYV